MNGKTKTQMEEIVSVENAEEVKDTRAEWSNAKSITEIRNLRRREMRSALAVIVKHNTPIEQVFMSAQLHRLIDDVFATTQAKAILAKLGNCEAVKLRAGAELSADIFSLYNSARKSYNEEKTTLGDLAILTAKGVKMDKYAFVFKLVE